MSDGLMKRIEGKYNVTPGGKILLASDEKSLMPRESVFRNEVHNDEGFTQEGTR